MSFEQHKSDRMRRLSGVHSINASGLAVAEANSAANRAAAAFPAWADETVDRRRDLLISAANHLDNSRADLIQVAMQETGASENWLTINIDTAVRLLKYAATLCGMARGETLPGDDKARLSMTMRQPVGVCLGMAAWNAPVQLAIRAIAVPLACGNTVVLKASELCPKTHRMLGEILTAAGIPEGVVNVVTNEPAEADDVVAALVAHPVVRRINFTGSTRVGRIIAEQAARHLKPCLLELSGKSPLLVLDDADIDSAVEHALFGSFINQGQICMSTERVILQQPIAEEFTRRFVEAACQLRSGASGDDGVRLGPLINTESGKRLQGLIDDAVDKGAEVLCGGKVKGVYLDATVISQVNSSMRIYHEECFGPIAQLITCHGDEESISLANDTEYGLSAAVFSRDINRALDIARRIESGICHINSSTVSDEAQAPFGGMKASGYGRFGGTAAVEEFTEIRWITVSANGSSSPPI